MVGANTVNGPAPFKVSTKPVLITAASKIDNGSVLTTIFTKVPLFKAVTKSIASCGNKTLSIVCATPFEAKISVPVMLALVEEASPITKVFPEAITSILLSVSAVPTFPAAKSAASTFAGITWYKRIFLKRLISASVSKSSRLL